MAQSSGGKIGGILGLLIAAVVLVALVGSPFYLGMLQASDRAAERNASRDVEDVRRIVMALDAHLAAIGDAGKAASKDAPDSTAAALPADLKTSLDQTTKMLQATEQADRQRGTMIAGKTQIQSGAPALRPASAEMRTKYAGQHEKLLTEADQKLRSITGGDNLGASRIKAIVEYARGRFLRNRAEFEHWQARLARDEALAFAPSIAELKIIVASLEAQVPTGSIAAVEARIKKVSGDIDSLEADSSKTSGEVAELKEKIADQERLAADARKKMAALAAAGKSTLSQEYQNLSNTARKAEADAAALQNGTLENAVPVESQTADIVPPQYQSGSPRVGRRDVEIVLADIEARRAAMEGSKKESETQLASLKELATKLEEQKSQAAGKLDEQTDNSKKLLSEADARDQAATTVENSALKAFAEASRAAKMAANAAKTRANDARTASTAAGGSTPDERLTRVSADGDTEGSMHCLAGEIAYYAALTHTSRIAAAQNSKLAGGESADKSDESRSAALKLINESLDAYKKAADAIGKTKAGTITGRNYLWQVQVAQAASTLLRANLAESADAGEADRSAAYKLLAEAAKGKEQSPLLTPAIDTLVYLQDSSR